MVRKLSLVGAALAAAALTVFLLLDRSPDPAPVGPGPQAPTASEEVAGPRIDVIPAAERERPSRTGSIRALVLREGDLPVAGAIVSAGSVRAETGADGVAVLEGVPAARRLLVRAEGPDRTDVAAEQRIDVSEENPAEARLVLGTGGVVAGRVTDERGQALPIEFTVDLREIDGEQSDGPVRFLPGGFRTSGRSARVGEGAPNEPAYEVRGIPPGRYVATARAEGYDAAESEPFEVLAKSVVGNVDLAIERGAVIAGVVLDARTGEPVAGALLMTESGGRTMPGGMVRTRVAGARTSVRALSGVTVGGAAPLGPGERAAAPGGRHPRAGKEVTDEAGRFRLAPAPEGQVVVVAMAQGYAPGRSTEVTVERGRDAEGVVIRLPQGGAITGTVYDRDGRPLPNAKLLVQPVPEGGPRIFGSFGTPVSANESGVYLIEHLGPGRYVVKRATEGQSVVVMSVEDGESSGPDPDSVVVAEGEVVRKDVRTTATGSIAGRVVNRAGDPVRERVELRGPRSAVSEAGAPAALLMMPRTVFTDAEGRYAFDGLEAGEYTVTAAGAEAPVQVGEGETASADLVVRYAAVEGIVVDETGRPVAKAAVRLTASRSGSGPVFMFTGGRVPQATTDEAGRFRIEEVHAGAWTILAMFGADRSVATEVQLTEAGIRDLRLALVPPVEVHVLVLDADGAPVKGAMVGAGGRAMSAPPSGAQTDENGRATLRLTPGDYWIQATLLEAGRAGAPRFVRAELTVTSRGAPETTLRLN